MCNAYEKIGITYVAAAVTCIIFLQVFYTGDGSDINFDDISEIIIKVGLQDISRYPYPNDIIARPDLGDCCNGLCSGDPCFVGDGVVTLNPSHCNNCCLRLTSPASCMGSSCSCYSNSHIV